jgi:hypothetical protein
VHLDHSSIFVTKLKVELERNQRIFSKCWGMFGWEAGTRTPIRRSRVLQLGFQRKKINNLARQNNNNSGKIRNTPAIKIVKVSTAMKTQRISLCLSIIPSESGRGRHITPANQGLVRLFPWSKG